MALPLAERLPPAIRPLWRQIADLDLRILACVTEQAQHEAAARLAEERSALIRTVCDALSSVADGALREEALQVLIAGNDALTARGSDALADAGSQAAAGAYQRRAITAYDAQGN